MHLVQLWRRCVSVRVMTLGLLSALVVGGCNRAGGPAGTVSVSGTVRSAGKTIVQGTVNFAAKEGAASGTAAIGAEGKFTVKLLPGAYRVAVIAKDGVDTMDEKGNPVTAKSLVPEKYASIATSGLEAKVSASDRTVDLDLKP